MIVFCNNKECAYLSKHPSNRKEANGKKHTCTKKTITIHSHRDEGLDVNNPLVFDCVSERKTDEIKEKFDSSRFTF